VVDKRLDGVGPEAWSYLTVNDMGVVVLPNVWFEKLDARICWQAWCLWPWWSGSASLCCLFLPNLRNWVEIAG